MTRLRAIVVLAIGAVLLFMSTLDMHDLPLRRYAQYLAAPWRWHMKIDPNVEVTVRDGTRLLTDVMTPFGEGPWPAILVRTPYRERNWGVGRYFTQHGYVVVNQSVRGRNGSHGVFTPSKPDGPDGYDTVTWIAAQPWSNGKVGTLGCSHGGESQIYLAGLNHPAHIAAIPEGAGGAIGSAMGSYDYFGIYENGVLALSSALGWFSRSGYKDERLAVDIDANEVARAVGGLPVAGLAERIAPYRTDFRDFVTHRLGDPWWDAFGYVTDDDRFSTAALHVNSWYDQTVRDTFRLAELMRTRRHSVHAAPQAVLIGPGNHCNYLTDVARVGDLPISMPAFDWWNYYLKWFDMKLKGRQGELPAYRVFVLGANEWQDLPVWPPKDAAPRRFFLSSGNGDGRGALTERVGDIAPGKASYRYDPDDPVPSLGGSVCCVGKAYASGSFDQRSLESRPDVLVYSSAALSSPLRVMGNNRVKLFVSSDAPDTDFTAKLIDVWPDGRAFNVQDSIVRARYRNGITGNAPPLEPDAIVELTVELGPIAYEFKAGHRIRLHISSSNFPRLARNLNTMADPNTSDKTRPALNTIHFSGTLRSHLELQALPASR